MRSPTRSPAWRAWVAAGLAVGCATSHLETPDAPATPDAGYVLDVAVTSPRPEPSAGGDVLAWGRTEDLEVIDVFVLEPGIVVAHRAGLRLLDRDGSVLADWVAPFPVFSATASESGVAVLYVEYRPDPATVDWEIDTVVVFAPDLSERARYTVADATEEIVLWEDLVSVRFTGRFRVPEPDRVGAAFPRSEVRSVRGGLYASRVDLGARGASVGFLLETTSDPALGGAGAPGGGGPDPAAVFPITFAGPEPNHVIIGSGDVLAIAPDCTHDCVTYVGSSPASYVALGPGRSGDVPTFVALVAHGPWSEVFVQPVLCGMWEACTLEHIDPTRTFPLWSVRWTRPVGSIIAIHHDPWANAVVIATFGADAGAPTDLWSIESVPM